MKLLEFILKLKHRSIRKKLIPHLKTTNPIIDDLVDLSIEYHYDYDTIYSVYTEWDHDLKATESVFVTALYMVVDPLDITQDRMRRFGDVLAKSMITIGEDNSMEN